MKGSLFVATLALALFVWAAVFVLLFGSCLALYDEIYQLVYPTLYHIRGGKPDPGEVSAYAMFVCGALAFSAAAAAWRKLRGWVVGPLFRLLADNGRLRRVLLGTGVLMFVAGSALQFAASFFD